MVQALVRFSPLSYPPAMDASKTPAPRELQLLALVISERIGREVAKLLEAKTGDPAPYGTVYTLLGDMAEAGWVKARDGERGGRRVRYFKLTGAGVAALARGRQYYSKLAAFGLPKAVGESK